MPITFRTLINSRTLKPFKPLLTKLRRLLTMADQNPDQETLASSSNDPPFDPSKPSIPISYPIKELADLESRSYFDSFHFPFNRASVPLPPSAIEMPSRPRLLVCHDFKGGYVDDKWVQGGANADAYAIWHWYLIDVFVYFSHDLVTLPPPCWTNAAHTHGVKVLGTFIAEWEKGTEICSTLLSTKESAQMYAERLTELAVALGFDGWLLNMEVDLDVGLIANLKEFVGHLTRTMHSIVPGSLVIWYDAVTIDGKRQYQEQLNDKNKPFFDLCDGLFSDYNWGENDIEISAGNAGSRRYDVYMGIDVFGRSKNVDGQWKVYVLRDGDHVGRCESSIGMSYHVFTSCHPRELSKTNLSLDILKKDDVSAALFAPGWIYETEQPPDFQTAQNRWWGLVEKSWGILQNYPKALPFFSNFDQGHGCHFSIEGLLVADGPWNNISCQGFQACTVCDVEDLSSLVTGCYKTAKDAAAGYQCQPVLDSSMDPDETSTLQVFINFKDASYSGGANITCKGSLRNNEHVSTRIFQGRLESPLRLSFSVKSDDNSLLGIVLQKSSEPNEKSSVLLIDDDVSSVHELTNKYEVILPQMKKATAKTTTGAHWVQFICDVGKAGEVFTEFHTFCMLKPDWVDSKIKDSNKMTTECFPYFAALGHISIRDPRQNPRFPPADSWVVGGEHVSWKSGSPRTVSLKIFWKLQAGYTLSFAKYNIYAAKLANDSSKFLGIARVETFYVSDLEVPVGTKSLKFIVQVCGFDEISQELVESPAFLLAVEDQ